MSGNALIAINDVTDKHDNMNVGGVFWQLK